MHIAIEGLDGVGKTSTAKVVADRLGFSFVEKPLHYFLDESGMENYLRITININNSMDNDFTSMFYGCGNYYSSLLAKKENIVTDRHLVSTYYWNGSKENDMFYDYLVDKCGNPDITFVLYVDDKTRFERIRNRNENDPDLCKINYGDEPYIKIEKFLKRYNMRYYILDTSALTMDEVVEAIVKKCKEELVI